MAPTSLYFDTATDADAAARWVRSIHQTFGRVDVSVGNAASFAGEMRGTCVGQIEINRVGCSSEDAARTRKHVAADDKDAHAVCFVLAGELHLEQHGRSCDLAAGQFTLFDLNAPYRHQHARWCDVLSIKIPGPMLDARLRNAGLYTGRAGCASHGLGRITRDALQSLADEAENIPPGLAAETASKIIDLVAIMIESRDQRAPAGESSVRTVLHRRIADFIETHLSDPKLDAQSIAAAQGISVRYLHRIFQDTGQSVCEFLRVRRLARCYSDLSQSGSRRLSIKEIAFRAGFSSQAHFATAFRNQYAMSPSELARHSRR